MIGFSEILQKQFYGALNDKQEEYVADILRSGNHLLDLINDILDLSQAAAGKLELMEEEGDLNSVVTQTLRMLRPRMDAKRIVAEVNLPNRILRVEGDRQKLKQVLTNLLTNAVKFTPEGGSVHICAMVGRDGAPSLIVEDTGVGIAPDDIDKVLKPFERAQSHSRLNQEGTGIGLPLSKSIVERHGGTLRLPVSWAAAPQSSCDCRRTDYAAAPRRRTWATIRHHAAMFRSPGGFRRLADCATRGMSGWHPADGCGRMVNRSL